MALPSLILGYVTDPTQPFKGQLILAAMFWAFQKKKRLYELNLSSLNLNHQYLFIILLDDATS